jgi:2-(1,2-epoxy-1,2-dihydrophenyl)acetyl-CoA isomerase
MSAAAQPAVVRLDLRERVARITLDRPQAGNAIDPALAAGLRSTAEGLRERRDVGVVVLAATGRAFCVGGDLRFMHAAGAGAGDAVRALAGDFHAALEALAALDAPLVTVVQGVAAGGGMSLAIAGDIVLAGASASFTMAYTQAGLSPDGGATWNLPRIVGVRRAAELTLLNETLDATAAAGLGLVTRVVPDERLAAEAEALAARLAAGPTGAYGAAKRLLAASGRRSLPEQLAAETESIAERAASADGREGIAAFLEKRAPRFGS